jgi:hypothetical protein
LIFQISNKVLEAFWRSVGNKLYPLEVWIVCAVSRNKSCLEDGVSRLRMYTLILVCISVDICHLDTAVTLRHGRIMALDSVVTARSKFSSNDKGRAKAASNFVSCLTLQHTIENELSFRRSAVKR